MDVKLDLVCEVMDDEWQKAYWLPVSGGCTTATFSVHLNQRTVFVKQATLDQYPLLMAERHGLEYLEWAGLGDALPKLHGMATNDTHCGLVMDYLALHYLTGEGEQSLAYCLSKLHRTLSPQRLFGLEEDHFIGLSPQQNGWDHSWPNFFASQRLKPQLVRASEKEGFPPELYGAALELIRDLPVLLDHQPLPVLLHGDLWSGNAAQLATGECVIFDPAVYFGDREADLALMRLFGGFSSRFFSCYQQLNPLPEGHERRRPIYQLYHILNHFNVSGERHYAVQAGALIKLIRRLNPEIA